ncbi:hypothetical protein [Flagellimonas aequoris]|uniref:Uncharacterized protein n=1 Tax=Flagellimonas aequoris TaxID=2306997 RepID=A0A418N7S3_9FLAO|nr:hypothetical protein [Allomuricauda aequoris]RIV70631.1 hypothetical protein D2U88_09695 [Allomuricauda aequoris]TXK02066.1 hypothetical protein FQ019_09620 [Allomuricauda aequoris]
MKIQQLKNLPKMKYIRIGFYEDFKGEDSILISVDIYGLLELETVFDRLSKGEEKIDMKDLKLIDMRYQIPLLLCLTEIDEGFIKVNNHYEWRLTSKKWDEFHQKAIMLYRNSDKGHQYLDSDSIEKNDFQTILSLDEYQIEFWEKFSKNFS